MLPFRQDLSTVHHMGMVLMIQCDVTINVSDGNLINKVVNNITKLGLHCVFLYNTDKMYQIISLWLFNISELPATPLVVGMWNDTNAQMQRNARYFIKM